MYPALEWIDFRLQQTSTLRMRAVNFNLPRALSPLLTAPIPKHMIGNTYP